jgi:hypothetical protein
MRVLEQRRCARLAQQPFTRGASCETRMQPFQRDILLSDDILSAIHDAHSPAAHDVEHAVAIT